jgi:tetratricopeptide (TPR) repeat protein
LWRRVDSSKRFLLPAKISYEAKDPILGGEHMAEPKLSCCMIVKNEERFLRRCLQSVAPYVDEIVIVDTGSQDKTVEIAREFTDKIYFHPWENDFSKHRNQSISYATGDWILQIDADEELAPGAGEAIRASIREAPSGVNFLMINITDVDQKGVPRVTFNFPRVFRNGVGIHYEGIVHNQVVGTGKCQACQAVIWHYGYYLEEEKMEAKRRRSLPLLLKQLEQDPENVFTMYNLANMYAWMKDYDKVIQYTQAALKRLREMDSAPAFFVSVFTPLIQACLKKGRVEHAKKYALESVKIFPQFLDGYYLLNEICFIQEDWKGVVESGGKAWELYDLLSSDPVKRGSIVWHYLNSRCHLALRTGAAFLKLEMHKEAREWFIHGLDGHPDLEAALRFVLKSTKEAEARDLYDEFLMQAMEAFPESSLFNRLSLEKAMAERRSYEEILKIFERLCEVDPEEDWEFRRAMFMLENGRFLDAEKAFGDLIAKRNPEAAFHAYRALAREHIGDLEGAIDDHEKAVTLDPQLFHCWIKIGEHSMYRGEWEKAWESFMRAREAGADGPEVLLRLAILGLRMGEVELSVEPLDALLLSLGFSNDRTLETMEELVDLFQEIGEALEASGQRGLAAEAYGIAVEMDPKRAKLALKAGKNLIAEGKVAGAAIQLASALRAAPDQKEVLLEVEGILNAIGMG